MFFNLLWKGPKPENRKPTLKISSDQIYFSLSGIPNGVTVKIELVDTHTDSTTFYMLTPRKPFVYIPVIQGRGYQYRYQSSTETRSSDFSSWEGCTALLRNERLKKIGNEIDVTVMKREILDALQIRQNNGESPIKIIVVGLSLSGKSTIINTIKTALEGKWKNPAISSMTDKTLTQKIEPIFFHQNLAIVDTPGVEASFDLAMFGQLLQGKLDGQGLEILKKTNNPVILPNVDDPRPADVIIFVDNAINHQDRALNKYYKEVLDKIKYSTIPSIAVLTQCDQLFNSGESAIDMTNLDSNPHVAHEVTEFKKNIGINTVIPFINYTEMDFNSPAKDFRALTLLDLAIKAIKPK